MPTNNPSEKDILPVRVQVDSDYPVLTLPKRFGPMLHSLYVHSSIVNGARKLPSNIRQRLSIMLQHLAAMGPSTRSKGGADEANSGWRRSPLGRLPSLSLVGPQRSDSCSPSEPAGWSDGGRRNQTPRRLLAVTGALHEGACSHEAARGSQQHRG